MKRVLFVFNLFTDLQKAFDTAINEILIVLMVLGLLVAQTQSSSQSSIAFLKALCLLNSCSLCIAMICTESLNFPFANDTHHSLFYLQHSLILGQDLK